MSASSSSGSLQTNAALYDAFVPVSRPVEAVNSTALAAQAASAAVAAAAGLDPLHALRAGSTAAGRPQQQSLEPGRSFDGTPPLPYPAPPNLADEVARLLHSVKARRHNIRVTAQPPATDLISSRDRCVFDACCGEGLWKLTVLSSELDYAERECGVHGHWVASLSVVARLSWGTTIHEETGSGQAILSDSDGGKKAAIELAQKRALASGSKRLAKRFVGDLSKKQWADIEAKVRLLAQARGATSSTYPADWSNSMLESKEGPGNLIRARHASIEQLDRTSSSALDVDYHSNPNIARLICEAKMVD